MSGAFKFLVNSFTGCRIFASEIPERTEYLFFVGISRFLTDNRSINQT